MCPIETRASLGGDRLPNHVGHGGQLVVRRGKPQTEGELDAAFRHPLVVANASAQQIGVGKYELLTRQAPQASGLQADMLDRSKKILDRDEITQDERLVEHDGKRREKIDQHALGGQRHGHAANAKAC